MSILHIIFDMLAFKATCTHHLHYGLCDPLWQNDIQFWRNNKSLQGLSLQKIRTDVVVSVIAASQHVACCSLYSDIAPLSQCVTVCVTVCVQGIIFLYLLDNDTSSLVLVSCGVGLLIDLWKMQKAVEFTIDTKHYCQVLGRPLWCG